MKNLFTAFCFLILQAGQAQFSFQYDTSVSVKVGTARLDNPWAGGINAAQFSTIHLDADTLLDLVTFDRRTGRISAYLSEKQDDNYMWRHAPAYEDLFPRLEYWMLLVDYDHDGRKDLFTHASTGVRIFRNTSTNGEVSWEVATEALYADGNLNVYVLSTDIPAITDIDGDGDIDLMTFGFGSAVDFYQNMSVERGKGPGGLEYKKIGSTCWGNFRTGLDCNDFIFGQDCGLTGNRSPDLSGGRVKHNGNSLLLLDLNADGNKDLLFGHVSCRNIARLNNSGTNGAAANFVSADTLFPSNNPIEFDIFPSVYWEDFDFDGIKDLVASPNVYVNEGNLIDFRSSNWLYRNIGTNQQPNFQLVRRNFLQETMIDLGESAAPVLADLDGDGDYDLLVGNAGIRGDRGFRAGLAYFENIGTVTQAAFELRSSDYLGISQQLLLTNLRPAVADIDGNGSLDLVFTGTTINEIPEIRYIPNGAVRGAAWQLELSKARLVPNPSLLDKNDVPAWVDIDRDGKLDLLIGKSYGNIEYHRNTGPAATPRYTLQEQYYGQLPSRPGALSPSILVVDFNGDQIPELLTGTYNGELRLYKFPNIPTDPLILLDSALVTTVRAAISPNTPGGDLQLAAADLTGDGLPDLMAGTIAGGIRLLRNTSEKAVINGTDAADKHPWVYPNPADGLLRVKPSIDGLVEILMVTGQQIMPRVETKARTESTLDLSNLPAGLYFVRFLKEGRPVRVEKVVVGR